jgi:hypothetical protein
VRIKNLGDAPRTVAVALVLPEGLEAQAPRTSVSLAPWEERAIAVPVVNRAVLAGSREAVFATVEYDEDAHHETVLGHGVVEIVAATSWIGLESKALWIAAAVLVAAWLGFLAARGLRSAPARRQS